MPNDQELSGLPQRKLTTILAADVVGYSRMMGVDENGTYELLGKCRKIIDRNIGHHGGRIFNTAGDSVMAEFSSTVEAVRCAIEIQEEIGAHNTGKPESDQMWFRIGLNVGDVIIEGDDLIGDGVNIASRMESIAPPSGICISGSVYELVRNKLSYGFEDIGKQSVKNIIDPVPAYSLLPAATSQISPGMAGKQPHRIEKKRHIGLPVIVAALLLLGALIAVAYFGGRNSGQEDSVMQQDVSPPPVPAQESASSALSSIAPSYFAGRTIEGLALETGERFVIEMTERGSAIVTIYKKNKQTKAHKTDSGHWWINQDERVCFEFKKFAGASKFCRIYTKEEGREWLVSGDPTKPKWVVQPR